MNEYEIEPAYSDVRLEGSTVHIGRCQMVLYTTNVL